MTGPYDLGWFRDTVLRLLPHATPPGLRRIGRPGRDDPVLLTGNFTLTVRRVERMLAGRDAWLLVADSNGINVWCAAGGGHLTHHEVIAAVRSSRIGDRVDHRVLVLPQLAATGVERRAVADTSGWEVRWGPARLEDLPDFLDRGAHVTRRHRFMRFPMWERAEMTLLWSIPTAVLTGLALGLLQGGAAGLLAAAAVLGTVLAIFALIPRVPVTGTKRWLTFLAGAAIVFGATLLAWLPSVHLGAPALAELGAASLLAMGVLSVDLPGTTPWYPSSVNVGDRFRLELVADRCTGAAECRQVCPRDVLELHHHRIELARPDDCIRCGACIVQCPEDALRFRFSDGRIVEPATIRSTRLNLLGHRTIVVDPKPGREQ